MFWTIANTVSTESFWIKNSHQFSKKKIQTFYDDSSQISFDNRLFDILVIIHLIRQISAELNYYQWRKRLGYLDKNSKFLTSQFPFS